MSEVIVNYKHRFFYLFLSVFFGQTFYSFASASSSENTYAHQNFNIQGYTSQNEGIEVSARNVKINGVNVAKKIKINAETVTINAGAKLQTQALEVNCETILIRSADVSSDSFISINSREFASYGSSWSSPVISFKVSDSLTLDLKSQIESNYLGFNFSSNGFSNHKIQGKILRKDYGKLSSADAKELAAEFCDPERVNSCVSIATHSGRGDVKVDANVIGFSSVASRGESSEYNIDFTKYSQIKGAERCNLLGKSLRLRGGIQCQQLRLDGIYHLWMSDSSHVESSLLHLRGGDLELNGKILSEQTSIWFTKNLTLNKIELKGGEAKIYGNSKLNVKHLSVLDLNELLQIRSLNKLSLSGETFSKILEISSPKEIKSSGKQTAESLDIGSGGKLDLSGKIEISEDGQVSITGEQANLNELEVQGQQPQGGKADLFSLKIKKDTNIANTRISGFQRGKIQSGTSLKTDKNTYIAIDDLQVNSPEMSLEGEFRSRKIHIKGNKITYNGRIIDAKDVEFMGDNSINIGSAAVLHVLHSLNVRSNQHVSISGEVVSQILDIAAPELLLLRNGNLNAKEKVAIYTSLWMKLDGTIDFSRAEAKLAATGKLDIDGILKYRNLEIRKANSREPMYSPGQKLALRLKSRAKLEYVKEAIKHWAKQDPEHDEKNLQDIDPEQLLDDENFSEFIKDELKKEHWKKLLSHSGKIISFLWQSALDSAKQSLSSSSLDMIKNGLYHAGVETLKPSFSLKSAANLFETAKSLGAGNVDSWKKIGSFVGSACHRGFADFAGLRPGQSVKELGVWGVGNHLINNKISSTIYGDLADPTRIALDLIQLLCTYQFMEEGVFSDRLNKILFGSHMTTKATILFLLGYEDLADKMVDQVSSKQVNRKGKPRSIKDYKPKEFAEGNLSVSADDILIEGTIAANHIKLKSERYSQKGKVSTKVAHILNEHFELLQSGELSVEDQGRIQANI